MLFGTISSLVFLNGESKSPHAGFKHNGLLLALGIPIENATASQWGHEALRTEGDANPEADQESG